MATELFLKEDKVKPGDCSGDFGMWGVGQCYLPPWPTGAAWGAKISSQPHQALYGHWVEGYPPSSSTDSYKIGKDTIGTSCSPSLLTRGAIFWVLGEKSLGTAVCQDFLVSGAGSGCIKNPSRSPGDCRVLG